MLVLDYLAPTLVFVSLLAFYALARTLIKSEAAALLSGCLYALFFLINIEPSVFTFGGEFISRITEDKFVAKFLFLPVSLVFAFAFAESRAPRYLVAFAFTCWSVMTTHPVGLAIIGLCVAGFGVGAGRQRVLGGPCPRAGHRLPARGGGHRPTRAAGPRPGHTAASPARADVVQPLPDPRPDHRGEPVAGRGPDTRDEC